MDHNPSLPSSFIEDLVGVLPSFIKHMRDVLGKIEEIKVSEVALLIGIDVKSLYIIILHEWGVAAVLHYLDESFPAMEHKMS